MAFTIFWRLVFTKINMAKKILLIIAFEGFQPKEYSDPKNILKNAGVEVLTASNKMGTAVSAYLNLPVNVDLSLDDVVVKDYSGIFLIGGPGALECLDNEKVYKIMTQAKENGLGWGAICISTRILAKANLLQNKQATGWNGDGELPLILKNAGAIYQEENVVVDDKLITAVGPNSASDFGQAILENL